MMRPRRRLLVAGLVALAAGVHLPAASQPRTFDLLTADIAAMQAAVDAHRLR